MAPQYTFTKVERLTGKKSIQELFTRGSSFYSGSLRVLFLPNPTQSRVLFSVPKRLHKKAVVRNKLKRRLREAYRLHKNEFTKNRHWDIAYIYTAREVHNFSQIEKSIIESIKKLENEA